MAVAVLFVPGVWVAGCAVPLAVLAVIIWRTFWTPLRTLPGPKWAKISGIWLWLHDIRGSAPEAIHQMHRKYGPIVRIAPYEVSVNDISVHNSTLYCQGPKFMKAPYFYDPFKTGPSGIFQSTDQSEHSALRRLVSRPYSRKSILDFEPEIHDSVAELVSVLLHSCVSRAPVDITKMLRCLSLDFITRFTYGGSMHAVQAPHFNEAILEAFDQFSVSNFMFMMVPSLRIPAIALLSLIPSKIFQAIPEMRERVKRALQLHTNSEAQKDRSSFRPLLMSEIEAAEAQHYPLSKEFLIADGLADIFAGTDTTSTMLILTLREIFLDQSVYNTLHQEVKGVTPNLDSLAKLAELETLPYLSACVKEGLRFSTPVRSRLPRICPPSGWSYQGHFMPKGTIVSSSPRLMDYNEEIFPSPRSFQPERWLSQDPARARQLEDVWAPFSKGSRGCIGKNLALAEIYISIASLVRRFRAAEVVDRDIVMREIFGVVFDKPIRVVLEAVVE